MLGNKVNDYTSFKDTYFRPKYLFTFGPVMSGEDKWVFKITFQSSEQKPLVFRATDREDAVAMATQLMVILDELQCTEDKRKEEEEKKWEEKRSKSGKIRSYNISASS